MSDAEPEKSGKVSILKSMIWFDLGLLTVATPLESTIVVADVIVKVKSRLDVLALAVTALGDEDVAVFETDVGRALVEVDHFCGFVFLGYSCVGRRGLLMEKKKRIKIGEVQELRSIYIYMFVRGGSDSREASSMRLPSFSEKRAKKSPRPSQPCRSDGEDATTAVHQKVHSSNMDP
jgi:hypothetical protein